ncbi:MAG: Rieske 2Fe-2S domain-containing protein [Pyrinomonadaceae bacterium]
MNTLKIPAGLEHSWHPIAWSKTLKDNPLAATVLDKQIVVFRDNEGKAQVMEDRCLHKGVKLSGGRCVSTGIECPYHGWIFNAKGEVVKVPSHLEGDKMPTRRVAAYRTIEQQETIWFTFSDKPYRENPPDWHFYEKHSFTTVLDIDCEYLRLMENLVDNPHAGYIHNGLLRGKPSNQVTATIKETETGVHIQTKGERARRSWLYRLFGETDREIYHTEEYIVPNIIRTIFSHQGRTHSSSQFVCVPVSEKKTRVFYRITLDFYFAQLFIPVLKLMVDKILHQDKDMLEKEAKQEWADPNFKRTFCKADTPSIWMARMAKDYAEKGPQIFDERNFKSIDVDYYL